VACYFVTLFNKKYVVQMEPLNVIYIITVLEITACFERVKTFYYEYTGVHTYIRTNFATVMRVPV